MKLEEALSKELYGQVKAAIDAINEKEPDKLKHIRYEDMSEGAYVLKDKYTALEADKASVDEQLKTAQGLIEQLKNGTKADENLQAKITGYETQIAQLQQENEALKTENALKFALAEAGAVDVDYLVFKAKEKGEVKLGEDGKIRNGDDIISGLKTRLPNMFKTSGDNQQQNSGGRRILENPLPEGAGGRTVTREQFKAMGYNERLQLKKENPEQYNNLMKG